MAATHSQCSTEVRRPNPERPARTHGTGLGFGGYGPTAALSPKESGHMRFMRISKRVALAAATTVAFAGISIGAATSAHASIPSICGNGGSGYCLNAWNGGGVDLPIKMYYGGYANDSYSFFHLPFMCHDGHVHANAPYGPCPFTSGSGLNTAMDGAVIAEVADNRNGLCVGTTSSSVYSTEEPCPDSFGNNGGWGTIWVAAGNSSCNSSFKYFLENRYWSDAYNSLSSLSSGGNPGQQAFVAFSSTATCWGAVGT